MSNYIIGIYDDRSQIFRKDLAERYKELTEFFIRHMSSPTPREIIYGKSINEVLNKALLTSNSHCLVMSIGHFIQSPKFFKYMDDWTDKVDFFITGHIIDRDSGNSQENSDNHYYGLHKQCLLVNLKYYKEFENPEWGINVKDSGMPEKVAVAQRASEDIHDDYTPLFLNPTQDTKVCTPYVDGWNFINTSLKNNLKVYNFHPKIRVTKRYAYPNKDLNTLKEQLDWIVNILNGATDCVFFWNTEAMFDVKKYAKTTIHPVKKLYSVAAGFKPNYILHSIGFEEDTEVIYFDYSKQALSFKKALIELWDGRDYPNFLRELKKKFKVNETFGSQTEGRTYEELWQKELTYWELEEIFYEHWQRYKKLKHTFIHCNLLENPEKIIHNIDNTDNSYIWWSNCFHTVTAHYTMSLNELETLYNNYLKNIHAQNNNIVVFGADHLDKKIEGASISELL